MTLGRRGETRECGIGEAMAEGARSVWLVWDFVESGDGRRDREKETGELVQ